MFDDERHAFCAEFYTVEKSIEVVVLIRDEAKTVQIDALRDERAGTYSTRSSVLEHVTLQFSDREPESRRVWVSYDLPWTNRDSADAALGQALMFLRERCSG